MGITEFLSNVKTVSDLGNSEIAIITIVIALIWLLIKFVNYVINRIDTKDDKQFDVIYKVIEDESFLEKLHNQPYLIKQLFYKRFYLLKKYQIGEIEFLMSQKNLRINLNDLTSLKSGHIVNFEDGRYIKTVDKLTHYWANNYQTFKLLIVIGFIFWIVVSAVFCIIFLKSTTLFYISSFVPLILEVYLLVKVEVVKTYLKTKDYIDDFIIQSIEYRDTHAT